jgi:hypothetical protein
MNIKRIQLKEAIKQIVRHAINERKNMIHEVAPPGKKAERAVMHVKKSLRDKHPDWDDEKITSVAIATAWKLHNKGSLEETDKTPNIKKAGKLNPNFVKGNNKTSGKSSAEQESNPIRKAGVLGFGLKQEAGLTSEHGNYSEKAELDLIKQIGQKVLELLAMHGNTESGDTDSSSEPEDSGDSETSDMAPDSFESPDDDNSTDDENEDDNGQLEEPKVSENFKIQTGPSCRTSKDIKDNPKNVRNPKLG